MYIFENFILLLALTVFTTYGQLCREEALYKDRYIDIEKFEIEEQGQGGEGEFLEDLMLSLEDCKTACCEKENCNVISYDNSEPDNNKKRCYMYECTPPQDCEAYLVNKTGLDTIFIDTPDQQNVNDGDSNKNENSPGSNEPTYSKNSDEGLDLAVQGTDTGTESEPNVNDLKNGTVDANEKKTMEASSTSSLPLSFPETSVNNDSSKEPIVDSNQEINSEESPPSATPPPLLPELINSDSNNGTFDSNNQINSEEPSPSSSSTPSQKMSSASVTNTNESLLSSANTTTSTTATQAVSTTTTTTTIKTTTTADSELVKQQEYENAQPTETSEIDNNNNNGVSETNSSLQVFTTAGTTPIRKPETAKNQTVSVPVFTSVTTTTVAPETVMKPTTVTKQETLNIPETTTTSTNSTKSTSSATVYQNPESNTSTVTTPSKENSNAKESTATEILNTSTHSPSQKQLNTSTESPSKSSTYSLNESLTSISTPYKNNINQVTNKPSTSTWSVATTSEKTTSDHVTTATTAEETTNGPVSTFSKKTTMNKVTNINIEETSTQINLLASQTSAMGMTSTEVTKTQTVTYKPEVITSPFVYSVNNTNNTQLENLQTGNKNGHDPSHAWSAALIAALSFGILFFVSVLAIIAKKCFDGWQRRHYSRIDYLVNGMYS